jgi:hypothetical protein
LRDFWHYLREFGQSWKDFSFFCFLREREISDKTWEISSCW